LILLYIKTVKKLQKINNLYKYENINNSGKFFDDSSHIIPFYNYSENLNIHRNDDIDESSDI
jgi:hypothetical protein